MGIQCRFQNCFCFSPIYNNNTFCSRPPKVPKTVLYIIDIGLPFVINEEERHSLKCNFRPKRVPFL